MAPVTATTWKLRSAILLNDASALARCSSPQFQRKRGRNLGDGPFADGDAIKRLGLKPSLSVRRACLVGQRRDDQ
jgi:hypothetical protein